MLDVDSTAFAFIQTRVVRAVMPGGLSLATPMPLPSSASDIDMDSLSLSPASEGSSSEDILADRIEVMSDTMVAKEERVGLVWSDAFLFLGGPGGSPPRRVTVCAMMGGDIFATTQGRTCEFWDTRDWGDDGRRCHASSARRSRRRRNGFRI